jgi:adenylate kinase family enzyme
MAVFVCALFVQVKSSGTKDMSIKELKDIIEKGGMTTLGWLEKKDLVDRANEALLKIGLQKVGEINHGGVKFPVTRPRRFSGNFIVLGATGSGKTSFIQAMTASTNEALEEPISKFSDSSVTEHYKDYESNEIYISDKQTAEFIFKDTVGFGANDIRSDDIILDIFMEMLTVARPVNGFIIVHKAERYREGYANDMLLIKNMLGLMDISVEHVILLVTHTGMLKEDVANRYIDELFVTINENEELVKKDNIIRADFPRLDELREPFYSFFANRYFSEHKKISKFLTEFKTPVNPVTYLLKLKEIDQEKMKQRIKERKKKEGWFT